MKELRITHYPQKDSKPFIVEVDTLREAAMMIETLATYDWFLFTNKIETKYPNSALLEVFDEEEEKWTEWYDKTTGITDLDEFFKYIDEYKRNHSFNY